MGQLGLPETDTLWLHKDIATARQPTQTRLSIAVLFNDFCKLRNQSIRMLTQVRSHKHSMRTVGFTG